MYRGLWPLRSWTIAVLGLAESLGSSGQRLLKLQIDRPLVPRARSCSVGQGTLGLDNFPLEFTVPRRRTLLLDSDGSDGRCARVWLRQSKKQTAMNQPCAALWTLATCVPIRRFLMSQSQTSRRRYLAHQRG